VIVPARFSLAFALGFSLLQPALTQAAEPPKREPAPLTIPATNQQQADAIAGTLKQSGLLQQYDIAITYREGVVELTGAVADTEQHDKVLHLVQGVPGVQRVVDHLNFAQAIVRVQAGGIPQSLPPVPPTNAAPPPVAPPAGVPGATPPEATPVFQAPAAAPYSLNPPRMPPYAWPTYAPYNNYSRVGYPMAYPYNSFPFIGPVYPFPKVPLGWRSVRLEWDDGFWWYSKTASRWDWWKLRYY
jgi:hypothetical protein